MYKQIKKNLPYILVAIIVVVVIVLYLGYESDDLMNRMENVIDDPPVIIGAIVGVIPMMLVRGG